MSKLAIIGSRTFINYSLFVEIMTQNISVVNKSMIVISGGAKGVDAMAEKWAKDNGLETIIHKPDYSSYPGYLAPLKRNDLIAEDCDYCLALWDGKSKGTKYTIGKCLEYGKEVKIIAV